MTEINAEQRNDGDNFSRKRWNYPGKDLDIFFQEFVPLQYEDGFCWRCKAIGEGEEERTTPFDEQPRHIQELIAGNAELLLELYVETPIDNLDQMREAGKKLLKHTGSKIELDTDVEGDIPQLREDMSRMHHEKWLAQFYADIKSGKRSDVEHRGAKEYDNLPPIELTIMKVQTLANWRVLASITDEQYELIREINSSN